MPGKTPAHSRVRPNGDTANVSKENVEFIRAALETWITGDMDAVREVFDPDVIVRLPEGWPEPGPFVGREEVMRQFERNRETWDVDTLEPISVIDAAIELSSDSSGAGRAVA